MTTPTITLRLSEAQFACDDQQLSLLDVLEAHRVSVEYQCRAGYCGSCRTRLLRGKVAYGQTPLAFIHQDEILPCCCMPLEDIELDL
ncbi:2Fe-2S ferredoxin-like protein [Affinibrenneria salicis]|uniref:2Fe-2S ferredoxin-like protein n=1 Tax=Affinibrenneria salicis TaxID=2590031 RepID=A0A5J5G087_9GAMM|nr:class I ribonucleotide reductase maintenance protein YfaE [Affinibrenneria salicis]KAA9000018.1 2Fe-2S ferredoxin-like protein [Affinibrenneria salicis]